MPKGMGYGKMMGTAKSMYASGKGDKMMGGKMGMMDRSGNGMATNRNIKTNTNIASKMMMKPMKKMMG